MWEPTVILGAIQLILTVGGTLAAVTWKAARDRSTLSADLARVELNMKLALKDALEESTKEIDDRIDKHVRYFGETVAAVRQKIFDVEIYTRDNFLRKDDMAAQLQSLNEKLDRMTK